MGPVEAPAENAVGSIKGAYRTVEGRSFTGRETHHAGRGASAEGGWQKHTNQRLSSNGKESEGSHSSYMSDFQEKKEGGKITIEKKKENRR